MIPNIFHFIYGLQKDFGGKSFGLVHYLAIKSCHEVNTPEKILFHYQYMPQGEWWERALPYLTLVKVTPPKYIFWNRLYHFAHQADILRLRILKKSGGIYLDLDTICVRPLTHLFQNDFVIGRQGGSTQGLCNAVMLAKPKSFFIKKWLNSYISFRSKGYGHHWDEHSVVKPLALSKKFPSHITIVGERYFHYPTWERDQLEILFKEVHCLDEAYVHHLWESAAWKDYLSELTIDQIRTIDTTYNLIARKFIS